MCDRVVSEDSFLIVYCLDKYKIQRMCDNTVNDSIEALFCIQTKIHSILMKILAMLYLNVLK